MSPEVAIEHDPHFFLLRPTVLIQLILAVAGFVFNIISIVATCHVPRGLTTHTRLIVNLGLSDALICACNVYIIVSIAYLYRQSCVDVMVRLLGMAAHITSLLILVAMAIDHYIAILKPMDYSRLMKSRNGKIVIIAIWIVSAFGGFSQWFSLVTYTEKHNGTTLRNDSEWSRSDTDNPRCDYVLYNRYSSAFVVFAATVICLLVMIIIYMSILKEVRAIIARSSDLTIFKQNKKALYTTALIVGTFAFLCVPRTLTMIIGQINYGDIGLDSDLSYANPWLYILFLSNSVCDPFIYAFRLREVQSGYKRLCLACWMCLICRRCRDRMPVRRRRAIRVVSLVVIDDYRSAENRSLTSFPTNRISHSENGDKFETVTQNCAKIADKEDNVNTPFL